TGTLSLFALVNLLFFLLGRLSFSWEGIGTMIAAGLTLAIYSFLYKDNPTFKVVENLYVGVALGYTVIITWFNALKPDLYDPLLVPLFTGHAQLTLRIGSTSWSLLVPFLGHAQYLLLVPMFLGIFMLLRFTRRLVWLSRLTFAFVIGLGAGVTIPNYIHTFILKQLEPSMRPVFYGGETLLPSINTLLILLGVISVLIYFFFSVEHKGPVGWLSRIGIWFLMISFGASFGYTVMGRMSLLIGRVIFLMRDWLGVIQ
ncbi:MAG TPA: hypothetical protein ACFYEM_02520, partial [Candidatus Hypogeohydataceae bacterium YC40]